jgi:uncharacterized protein YjbI with pentapeptide repeats
MEQTKIKEILESHQKWLNGDSGRCANLRGANLWSADLRGANLQGADLRRADLQGAELRCANLWGAELRCANLRGANLQGADLRGANLRRADLRGAELRCANLQGANLQGANMDRSCLPLWRGSLNIKIDKRIAAQIVYHFCAMDCNDPQVKEIQESLYAFANTFHKVGIVPRLGD